MVKESYHPKAYLSSIKNIKRGLQARTRILNVLDTESADAKGISNKASLHYGVVMHHLKLLEAEAIVERKQSKPHIWALTGIGQRCLVNLG